MARAASPFFRVSVNKLALRCADADQTAEPGKVEAGTGIEPVFTDLQSHPFPHTVKSLGAAAYQDKACTGREPDTLTEGPENENPGALAGATGADQLGISFKTAEYRNRAEAATALCHAIAECEPEDAAPILEAALMGMGAGQPVPPLLSLMDEARTWADWATVSERKAYCVASFNCLSATERAAFLAHVGAAA